MSSDLTIRPLETIAEYQACVDLQEETWGHGFSERVPTAILKVSQMLGGVAAGAFLPDGRLMGFVFGMTGLRHGETVHWSDMLAVRREAQHSGLGARLKAYQRDCVMSLGIATMYWTFDPLRSRNAFLNFHKLGIMAREYVQDMYGATDSPLHSGIGTDRLVALWMLESERVKRRLGGELALASGPPDAAVALASVGDDAWPRPGLPELSCESAFALVAIPSDIGGIMDVDPGLALAWREATRTVLGHYLAAGYEAREFVRGTRISHYVLARREDPTTVETLG